MNTNNSNDNEAQNSDKNMTFLKKYKKAIMFLAFAFWIGFAALYSMQSDAQESFPVGDISKQQLLESSEGFATNYYDYQLSEKELAAVEAIADKVSIKVFFGTWCHDSEREVPRLLQSFKNSAASVSLIALDGDKSDPAGLAKQSKIKYTPTFVVYADNVEIGRIIERPKQSLAEDIWMIWYKYSANNA
ncbi:thioredoxin family protein [Thalassotalea psychrophila]|uniref:Thioredoxin family protein n=1 Tax=Thalassotalea psychrophila TaxID=3065647 RepID=A0ABY9TRC5_9GAMM|nr:thioredoxin family protein [Colwelliaceae bacterium SQ149]